MANINGVRTTLNITQARRAVDMAKRIALLDPDAAPLITFLKMAQGRQAPCVNPKFQWLEDALLGRSTTTSAAALASDTTLAVTDGSIFRIGDIINIPSTGENMLVTAIASNTLTVTRAFGTTAAAAVSSGAAVLLLGTAQAENATLRTVLTTQTTAAYNYTQIFRTPFALSGTEAASELYGENDRSYQRAKALIEHKIDIAKAFYFGQRKEDSTGATPRRATGGLDSFMVNTVAFHSSTLPLTYANFDENVAQAVFSHGSKNKLLIAGPKLTTAINGWAEKKLVTEVDRNATYGMRVRSLITSYGDLKVVYDPLLADGSHDDYGYVVDTENIRYRFLKGRDTKLNTNIQAPDVDGLVDEYLTECGLELKLPETHIRITGAYVPAS